MDIALLNRRITIQRNTPYSDAIGNHRLRWEDYYCCACTVSGETGQENESAGTTVDDTNACFTIRWCDAAAAITNTGFRVLFDGAVYDILAVDHMSYKRKSLKIRCRKARC